MLGVERGFLALLVIPWPPGFCRRRLRNLLVFLAGAALNLAERPQAARVDSLPVPLERAHRHSRCLRGRDLDEMCTFLDRAPCTLKSVIFARHCDTFRRISYRSCGGGIRS